MFIHNLLIFIKRSSIKTGFILQDLKDQLKALAKTSDESIDEGYGDNSIVSSVSIDIPSPKSISPVLLDAASNILLQCKDFYKPVQTELEQLKLKLNKLKEQYTT